MSDNSTGYYPGNNVIVEDMSSINSGSTTEAERAAILAHALGQKEESQVEEQTIAKEPVEEKIEEKPQEDDQFSAKFAALSRKEKAVREKEAQLEARLAELEGRSKEVEEKYGKYSNLGERLKNQPLDVLAEEGVDFDTLIKMVLENDGKPTTEMQIQRLRDEMQNKYMKELDNLKQELATKEKTAEEQRQQEVVEDYKYELNEFIESQSEEYELIKLSQASDLVYQVVEEHYNDTGKILSNQEACEHVESYLLEEAKKHLNVNKIKKLLNPEPAPPQPNQEQKTAAKTLSNMEASTMPNTGSRFTSDDESKREAAKLIRWFEE